MELKEAREVIAHYRKIDEKVDLGLAVEAAIVLDDQITELTNLLKEILPQFYGTLYEKWGQPKDWPKHGAAGEIAYEEIKRALGIDSDKEDKG